MSTKILGREIDRALSGPDLEEAAIAAIGDQPLDAATGELLLEGGEDLFAIGAVLGGFLGMKHTT